MKLLSNKELLDSSFDDCLAYLRKFKAEMNKIKEIGKHKEHNKMEEKYKKQKALVIKYKEAKLCV